MTQSYSEIKAISIHAPHAYAKGIKGAEYRSRPTKQRGWILIHSSQSKASDQYFTDYGTDKATFKSCCIHSKCFGNNRAKSYFCKIVSLAFSRIEDIL